MMSFQGMPVPTTQRSPSSSSLESSTPPSPVTGRMGEQSSSPPRTHNGRQRLRPWLIGLVDRGEVKGLEWMNKEKTLFKIPWKHAGKQDYNPEEDSKVFKLWSTNTGKYKEGVHVPEPAVWKTRLRTALNKLPDIDEIQEKTQLDIPEPYRVYRLLPKKTGAGRHRTRSEGIANYGHHEDPRYTQHISHPMQPLSAPPHGMGYQRNYHGYDHINGGAYHGRHGYYGQDIGGGYDYTQHIQYRRDPISPPASSGPIHPTLDDINDVIQENPSPTSTPQFGSPHDMSSCSPQGPMYPNHSTDVPDGSDETATKIAQAMLSSSNNNDPAQINNYHDLLPPASEMNYPATTRAYPGYVSHQEQHYNTTCAPVTMSTDTMTTGVDHHRLYGHGGEESMEVSQCRSEENTTQSDLPSEHSMTIEVYYRSMRALSRQVDNPNGCMLYAKQPWDDGIQLGMEAIHLPDITDIVDPNSTPNASQTITLTNDVLNAFAKGISIQLKDSGDIYVTRRCRSVVFWSVAANPEEHQKHQKLEREEEVKVFDLKEFRDKMRRFLCGEAKSPQIPNIYFTVAQKWGPDVSLHSCLVSIVVQPLRAAVELRSVNHDIKSLPNSNHKGMLQFSEPDVPTPPNQPWSAEGWTPHTPQTNGYSSPPPTQVFAAAACMT